MDERKADRPLKPIKIDPEAYYLTDDVALLRRVSRSTLEAERCHGGGIPYSRIGKRVFYLGADIIAYLEGRRQVSTSDTPIHPGPAPRPKKKTEEAA